MISSFACGKTSRSRPKMRKYLPLFLLSLHTVPHAQLTICFLLQTNLLPVPPKRPDSRGRRRAQSQRLLSAPVEWASKCHELVLQWSGMFMSFWKSILPQLLNAYVHAFADILARGDYSVPRSAVSVSLSQLLGPRDPTIHSSIAL